MRDEFFRLGEERIFGGHFLNYNNNMYNNPELYLAAVSTCAATEEGVWAQMLCCDPPRKRP